ncbi:kelch-like protein 6 isoform X1 [Mya arenaria]|uniref:kelch-like protein 6 isoform X1 n=1 Tax=Mya arenaria TaxID=6604 RepID=UPI0022E2AF3D|nr:kelch-like protein 6 isoform X1 [Mya arenaria]
MNLQREALSNGLETLRLSGQYTDFTIVADNMKVFPCHKAVLAATSPFFQTMFSSDMQEAMSNSANLPFTEETTERLLQFIYTGRRDVIKTESVPELFHAANFLQLSTLSVECEDFLSRGISPEISLEIWQIAKLFEIHQIAEAAKSIVIQNFGMFITTDAIGQVAFGRFKDLLGEVFLNCSGTVKCTAGWVWFIAQEEPSEQDARSLISVLLKAQNVENKDILGATLQTDDSDSALGNVNSDIVKERKRMWDGACEFYFIKESQPTIITGQMGETGRVSELCEWLVVVGGANREKGSLTVLNYMKQNWYSVDNAPPTDLGYRYAICARGSLLYLSGGTKPKQFLFFDEEQGRWERLNDLPVGREQHTMVTVGQDIFVLSGISREEPEANCSVYKYSTSTMQWHKDHGTISFSVAGARSVVIRRIIYLLGGCAVSQNSSKPANLPCDKIQCFDTSSSISWNFQISLPVPAKCNTFSAVVVNDITFVVHKGEVYQICEKTKHEKVCEKVCKIPNTPMKGFAVAAFGDKLVVFGGEDGNFEETRRVLQFDTSTNTAAELPMKLPIGMSNFCYTKIMVPDSWSLTEMS